MSDHCKCGAVDHDRDHAAMRGEPAFTVESDAKTHHVYWRSREHFEDLFSRYTYAYAGVGRDYIVLNEWQAGAIDNEIVAHEVGHNLGYNHVDESVMDGNAMDSADRADGVELHDVSVAVFEAMDDVLVGEWTRGQVTSLVRRYFQSEAIPRPAVIHAIRRYMRGEGPDALFLDDWRLGDNPDVLDKHLLAGSFY